MRKEYDIKNLNPKKNSYKKKIENRMSGQSDEKEVAFSKMKSFTRGFRIKF